MNPQKETPGWTAARRRRHTWLRSTMADQCGSGNDLDAADLGALPAALRTEAKRIAAHAISLHDDGEQAAALNYAREAFGQLEQKIGERWAPPVERPDPAILDEIQGRKVWA